MAKSKKPGTWKDELAFYGKTSEGRDKTDKTLDQIAQDLNETTIGGLHFRPSVMDPEIRNELGNIVGISATAFRNRNETHLRENGKYPDGYNRLGYLREPAPDLSPLGVHLGPGATIGDLQNFIISDAFEPEILRATQHFARNGGDAYKDARQSISARMTLAMQGTGIENDKNSRFGFDPARGNFNAFMAGPKGIIHNALGQMQRDNRVDAQSNSMDMYEDLNQPMPHQLIDDPFERITEQSNLMNLDQFRNRIAGGYRRSGMSVAQARELANRLNPEDFSGLTDEQIKMHLEWNGIPMPGPVARPQFGSYSRLKVYPREYSIFNPPPSNPDDPRHYKDLVANIASYSDANTIIFPNLVQGLETPVERAREAARILDQADGFFDGAYHNNLHDRSMFNNDEAQYKQFVRQIKSINNQVNMGRGGLGNPQLVDSDENPILSASTFLANDERHGPYASPIADTKFYPIKRNGRTGLYTQQQIMDMLDHGEISPEAVGLVETRSRDIAGRPQPSPVGTPRSFDRLLNGLSANLDELRANAQPSRHSVAASAPQQRFLDNALGHYEAPIDPGMEGVTRLVDRLLNFPGGDNSDVGNVVEGVGTPSTISGMLLHDRLVSGLAGLTTFEPTEGSKTGAAHADMLNRNLFNTGRPIEEVDGAALEKQIENGLAMIAAARAKLDHVKARAQVQDFRARNDKFSQRKRMYFDPAEPEGPPDEFAGMTSARNFVVPERFGWNAPIPQGFRVVQSNHSRMSKDGLPMHSWVSAKEQTIYYNPAGVMEMYETGSMYGPQPGGVLGLPEGSAETPEEAARLVSMHEARHAQRIIEGTFGYGTPERRRQEENIANKYALSHKRDKLAPNLAEQQMAAGQLIVIPSDSPMRIDYEVGVKGAVGFPGSGNSGVGNPPPPEEPTDWETDVPEPEEPSGTPIDEPYRSPYTSPPKGKSAHRHFMEKAGLAEEPTIEDARQALSYLKENHPGWVEHFAGVWNTPWKQFDAYFADMTPEGQKAWYTVQAYHHSKKGARREGSDPLNAMYNQARKNDAYHDDPMVRRLDMGKAKATGTDYDKDAGGPDAAVTNAKKLDELRARTLRDGSGWDKVKEEVPVIPGTPGVNPLLDPTLSMQDLVTAGAVEDPDDTSGVHRPPLEPARNRPHVENGSGYGPQPGDYNPLNDPDSPMRRVSRGGELNARLANRIAGNYFMLSDPRNAEAYNRFAQESISMYALPAESMLRGTKKMTTRTLASGQVEPDAAFYEKDGKVTVDQNATMRGVGLARAAASSAISGDYSGLNETEQMVTFNNRINKYVDDYVKKNFPVNPHDDPEAKAVAEGIRKSVKAIAQDAARPFVNEVANAVGPEVGWREASFSNANSPKSIKALEGMMEANPDLKERIGQMGGAEAVWRGQSKTIIAGNQAYEVGQGGAGGGRGGGGGDMDLMQSVYRTPIGRAQMAAFMGKMVWQETGGVVMDDAQRYRDYSSRFTSMDIAAGGQPSAAQLGNANIDAANLRAAQVSYKQFGWVGDMAGAMGLSGNADMGTRLKNDALVGAGIAGVGTVGSLVATGAVGEIAGAVGTGAFGTAATALGGGVTAGLGAALPVGLAVGGVMAGGDWWNAANRRDEITGLSFKNTVRGLLGSSGAIDPVSAYGYTNEEKANYGSGIGWTGNEQTALLAKKGVVGRAAEADYFSSGIAGKLMPWIGAFAAQSPEESRFANLAERISGTTRIDAAALADPLSQIMAAGGPNTSDAQYASIIQNSQKRGVTAAQYMQEGASYATSQGAYPNTPEFLQQADFFGQQSAPIRAQMSARAGYENALSSQLSYVMGGRTEQEITGFRKAFGLNNQTSVGLASSAFSMAQMAGLSTDTDQQQRSIMNSYVGKSYPMQQAMLSAQNFAISQGMTGTAPLALATNLANTGLSSNFLNGLMGGNAYDWSDMARQNAGDPSYAKYEQYDAQGRRSGEASGYAVANYAQAAKLGSYQMSSQAFLQSQGVSAGFASTFLAKGFRGTEDAHDAQMYGFQMASIGLQYQGIAAQQQMYWGSGSASAPADGSAWGIEDKQIALSFGAQMASMAYQRKQLDTQNQFAIANEAAGRQASLASRSYQNWDMGFNQQSNLISRDVTRAGWQYQTQSNALNYSWNMQDLDENIRRSSGRDRSLLIRQRDRATISENMSLSETDRQRTAQEAVWKREDEHYKAQQDYIKQTQKFEDDAFKRQQSQRETLYAMESKDMDRRLKEAKEAEALQTQSRELQRQFQAAELERSKQALGIQAAQVAAQYQYNEDLKITKRQQEDLVAKYQQITGSANGIKEMADSLVKISQLRFKLEKDASGAWVFSSSTVRGDVTAPKGVKPPWAK